MELIGLLVLGIIVGFINIISAGGSLITLPALIFYGLPPVEANGTNRISILVQNFFAILQFNKNKFINWKLSFLLAIPATIASIIGAYFAIEVSEKTFNNSLAAIMILLIILITVKPQKYIKVNEDAVLLKKKNLFLVLSFLIIGFYGGFIQAGVGFLIIISMTLLIPKISLAEIHSVKAIVITIYLIVSTIVFIYNGQINWLYALVLSIGSGIGGWIGGRFTINVSEKILRNIMLIVVVFLAVRLLLAS